MGRRRKEDRTEQEARAKRWAGRVERMVRADRTHKAGLSHQQMVNQRGFAGTTLGPANAGRRLSREEVARIEAEMKARGDL